MDPVDVEVIRCSFANFLREAEANICETAFSPIVYEVRDFCTALLTPDAQFVAQGLGGVPIFLGDLDAPVRDLMRRHAANMKPGDVYLTNEAAVCGQHLNNVVALRPVFVEGELELIAAVRVHWVDIGGRAAGGWVSDTTDIYQEGLQLPCVLAVRGEETRQSIVDLVAANVRYARDVLGDMRAQIAATRLLDRRYQRLRRRYAPQEIQAATEQIWSDSETLARRATDSWENSTGTAQAVLDAPHSDIEPPRINVTVTKNGDGTVLVDFDDTSPQVASPMNSKFGAAVAARIAYKMLTTPDRTVDQGAFRALQIHAPRGTFLSCGPDAPLAQWSAPLPTAVDTVLAAMGKLVPDHVSGAHHGELGGFALYGTDPDTGEDFYQIDTITGGWGGTPNGSGRSALKSICHGDTYTTPVELEERSLPLLVRAYRLRDGSGGAGAHPGGFGTERVYEIPTTTYLNLGLVRAQLPPWGVRGGQDGEPSYVIIERPDEPAERLHRATGVTLPAGTRLTIRSGGGGGYGHEERQ